MKLGSILALSAFGAAYYAHRRRGGELTLDSVRDSVDAFSNWMKDKLATIQADTSAAAAATGEREPVFPTPSGYAGSDGL